MALHRFANGATTLSGFHAAKPPAHALADTLTAELSEAIKYAVDVVAQEAWMQPIGKAASVATPSEIKLGMTGELPASSTVFGGASVFWT